VLVIGYAQSFVFFALYFAVFVLSVWALIDLLTRPAGAFVSGGKRTKNFWLALTGAGTAIAFVAIPPPPPLFGFLAYLGIGLGALSFLALGSAVAAIVYLVDVRPAIRPYSGPRGGRGGRGGNPPSRGGW
jgi:hypothetical protein